MRSKAKKSETARQIVQGVGRQARPPLSAGGA